MAVKVGKQTLLKDGIGGAGPAIQGMGGAVSAYASFTGGSASKRAAYKQTAMLNDQSLEIMAQARKMLPLVRYKTAMDVIRNKRDQDMAIGIARVAQGASGVSGGSLDQVIQDTAGQFELDSFLIRRAGLMQEEEIMAQAEANALTVNMRANEVLAAGRAADRAGQLGAISSILGSVGSFAGSIPKRG